MTVRRIRFGGRTTAATALLVGVAALTGLSACGAGTIAQTANQVAPVGGTNIDVGPNGLIQLRNVMVAYTDPNGYPVGSSAPLVVRIFNNGPKAVTLVGVDSPEVADSVSIVSGGAAGAPSPVPPPLGTPPPSPSPNVTAQPPASPSGPATGSPSLGPTSSPGPAPATASPGSSGTPNTSPAPATAPPPAGTPQISIAIAPAGFALLVPGEGQFLQLNGLKQALIPGQTLIVTFRFSDGTVAPVPVPVGLPTGGVPRGSVQPGVDVPQD